MTTTPASSPASSADTSRAAEVMRLLDHPLDAIFDHGPGITSRQYHALRRYLAGSAGRHVPTMGDVLGMGVTDQLAEGPQPFDPEAPTDLRVFAWWQVYRRRGGLAEVHGISEKSAHEIRDAAHAWFRGARAEIERRG